MEYPTDMGASWRHTVEMLMTHGTILSRSCGASPEDYIEALNERFADGDYGSEQYSHCIVQILKTEVHEDDYDNELFYVVTLCDPLQSNKAASHLLDAQY